MSKLKLKFKIEDGNLLYSEDGGCTYELIGVVGGSNGTDGADGTNGTNGVDGRDGVDGVTPTVEIDGNTGEWIINGDNTHVVAIGQSGLIDIGDSSDIGHIGTPSVTKTVVGNKTYLHFHNLKGADGNGPTITAVRDGYQMKFYSNGVLFATVNENIPYTAVPDSHVTVNNTTHQIGWDLGAGNGIEFNGNNQIALKQATNAAIGGMKLGTSSQIDSSAAKTYPIGLNASGQAFVNVPWDGGYTPAPATDANLGCIKIGYTESGKNYPVELDANSKAFVNVPWTDVPTKKNELIYSDNGQTLNTHPLMFEGGLVVDTPEDLALCKTGADVSMSVILKPVSEGGWVAYGSNTDDKNQWGYCDSEGDGTSKTVTKVGGATQSVPIFKYKGAAQDYIFNTKNTSANTGYYSPDTYDEFDSIITCGVLPSMQSGGLQDYMGIVPALTLKGEKNQNDYNYGIGIHVENESSNVYGRPNSAGGDITGTTIQIIAFKQPDLNSTSSVTNINILTAPQGKTVIPYNSSLDNASGSQSLNTSCIQTRTIRKGNIITFYASDPYKVCTTDLNTYNDDYNFKDTIHLDRPIIINLDTYIVTYVKADGTIGTNDYSTGTGNNATIREIFDKLKGSAHRGFEAESNPGTFFRNCSAHERIIDVTPGTNKVYDYDGSRWNWSFDTETSMPTITVGGSQYTLSTETVGGGAPYKWENSEETVTEYYTKHPVPDITLTTPDVAYASSAATDEGTAISAVNGVKMLPLKLFANGSRIAWNRLTDKIFYNDGGSIYRIGADEKQDVKTSTAKMYLTGILTAPTSDDVPHTGVANSGVYATNGYFHSANNIECGMETHPSDATSNYTSVPTDPIDIDYTSKKYHIINTSFENNTSNPFIINLKDSGSFEGVREVIIRIHNRSVNNASPIVKVTADTGVTLTNLFDANIVSSGKDVAPLSGDSAELVFTFWGTADVTLKGHLKLSANT